MILLDFALLNAFLQWKIANHDILKPKKERISFRRLVLSKCSIVLPLIIYIIILKAFQIFNHPMCILEIKKVHLWGLIHLVCPHHNNSHLIFQLQAQLGITYNSYIFLQASGDFVLLFIVHHNVYNWVYVISLRFNWIVNSSILSL